MPANESVFRWWTESKPKLKSKIKKKTKQRKKEGKTENEWKIRNDESESCDMQKNEKTKKKRKKNDGKYKFL